MIDVPKEIRVVVHALQNTGNMVFVQLQEPTLDHVGGNILFGDTDEIPAGAAHLHHQLHIVLQRVRLVGVLLEQKAEVDIVLDDLSVGNHKFLCTCLLSAGKCILLAPRISDYAGRQKSFRHDILD